jgi:hypothetical protein
MNYYQDTDGYYNENYEQNNEFNDLHSRSMFKDVNDSIDPNRNDYDPEYDMEVNRLLEEAEKDFLLNEDSYETEENDKKYTDASPNYEREKFEDYYNEFSENEDDDDGSEEYNTLVCSIIVHLTKLHIFTHNLIVI